jgi:hypothetical protein
MRICIFVRTVQQEIYLSIYNTLKVNFENVEIFYNCSKINFSEKLLILTEKDLAIFLDYNFFDYTRSGFEKIMKKSTCIKLSIGFDDEYNLPASLYLSKFMNAWITFDNVTYDYMRQVGLNVYHIAHPVYFKDDISPQTNYVYDVSFIGNVSKIKSSRKSILNAILKEFPNSYIPGLDGKYIDFEDMINVFRKSKININLSGISDLNLYEFGLPYLQERHGFKGRPFEIGGVGGFCLSEYSPSIENFLIKNVHIDYFVDEKDALKKIHFYLDNENKRIEISKNLNNWVKKNCYEKSSENMFLKTINTIINNNKTTPNLFNTVIPVYSFEKNRALYQFSSKNFYLFLLTIIDLIKIKPYFKTSFLFLFFARLRDIIFFKFNNFFKL